jgi:hypothetical protein
MAQNSWAGIAAISALRSIESIDAPRRVTEQRRLVLRRGAGSDMLECVPQGPIANPHLVNGKVAFERATPSAECFDAGLDVGPPKAQGPSMDRKAVGS